MAREQGSLFVWRAAAMGSLAIIVALALCLGMHAVRGRACGSDGRRRARCIGIGLILLVVLLWTSSSVIIQLVFEEAHFRKPFFLTWYGVALLVVYLPFYPQELRRLCAALADDFCGERSLGKSYELVAVAQSRDSRDSRDDSAAADGSTSATSPTAALGVALRLGVIFFAYQLCFNIGLELCAVSTVTVISASSGLWTLLFSFVRLRERVGPVKLLSTLLTFAGVMLVVISSGDDRRPLHHGRDGPVDASASAASRASGMWGNGSTLLSALLYGLYAAQLKLEVPDESAGPPMAYLFGLIGLVASLLLLPLIPVLHVLHVERFALPSRETMLALTLNGLLGSVLSNMLLAKAMLLASPLVATVGLSLSIPLAIAADALRGRGHFADVAPLLGTAAVWAGFLGVASEGAEPACCRRGKSVRVVAVRVDATDY